MVLPILSKSLTVRFTEVPDNMTSSGHHLALPGVVQFLHVAPKYSI